jgi:PEP-CTERM motif
MLRKHFLTAACLTLTAFGSAAQAETIIPQSALVPSTTYYTDLIGGGIGSPLLMTGGGNAANVGGSPNDDGFSGPINLGFTLNFFGTNYTQFWANNNGNISFGAGIEEFTPSGPVGANQPVISPFFADVDTRNVASGLMSLRNNIANQVIVTWDQVGYFDSHADKLNSFQLVLRGPGYAVPSGEGSIGFFYKTMQWETGDASGGTGGFGGTPAAVGFGNGAGDGQVLQGSLASGISSAVNNHHAWFNLSGGVPVPVPPGPTPVPEPASLLLLGSGAALLLALKRRMKR